MKVNPKILILSFIFAFALWLYIELNLSYSIDIAIPVEVQTLKSQALAEEIPSSIDVTVKGKGWDLLNMMITKDLKYNLDVSKLKKDSKIITEQLVNERLNLQPNLTVLEINPDTIVINFDKATDKIVPLRNNIVVNLKDGYTIVGNPKLTPDSVRVQGASYLINKIKSIPTETRVFNNVNSNIEGVIGIKDTLSNLIKVDRKQTNFSYLVQLSAEKTMDEVKVNIVNVPEDKEVILIPPNIKISLRGGVDQLAQTGINDIRVNVEFGKLESDTLGFIVPEIKLPDDVVLLKSEPAKLQYIIKNKL